MARERIYFATPALVELFKQNNPNVILTRFISTESDVIRNSWLGYEISYQEKANNNNQGNNNQGNVPQVA
jgi:hypothetical protein